MHIIKVFSFAVHSLFQEQPSADGVAQFLKILAQITHITHSGTIDHGGLRDGTERLFTGLPVQLETQTDAFTSLNERRQPSFPDHSGVAVTRDIEIGVVRSIQQ